MSGRPRRKHSPAFKAKVVMAAIQGDKALVELSQQYDVHQNQITDWRKQLLENAASVFGGGEKAKPEVDLKQLHAKTGQQALETDFLEGALSKAGWLSEKR